jgi:MscS family membrane protein
MKKFFTLFLLFNTALFASNKEVDIDLSSPRSTIYTHLYFLQENTFDPLKSASTI